jgi:hypothetical protein
MKKLNRGDEGCIIGTLRLVFLGCLNGAASGGSQRVNTHTIWNEVRKMKQLVGLFVSQQKRLVELWLVPNL